MPVTNLDHYDLASGLSVRMTRPVSEWEVRYEGGHDTRFDLHYRATMPPDHNQRNRHGLRGPGNEPTRTPRSDDACHWERARARRRLRGQLTGAPRPLLEPTTRVVVRLRLCDVGQFRLWQLRARGTGFHVLRADPQQLVGSPKGFCSEWLSHRRRRADPYQVRRGSRHLRTRGRVRSNALLTRGHRAASTGRVSAPSPSSSGVAGMATSGGRIQLARRLVRTPVDRTPARLNRLPSHRVPRGSHWMATGNPPRPQPAAERVCRHRPLPGSAPSSRERSTEASAGSR